MTIITHSGNASGIINLAGRQVLTSSHGADVNHGLKIVTHDATEDHPALVVLTGTLVAYGVETSYGYSIEAGAFTESLQRWKAAGESVPLLWQHDPWQPIGRFVQWTDTEHSLDAQIVWAERVPQAVEARELIAQKIITRLSAGFNIHDWRENRRGELEAVTLADLWEGSVVTWGANPGARVHTRDLTAGASSHGATGPGGTMREEGISRDADWVAVAERLSQLATTLRGGTTT